MMTTTDPTTDTMTDRDRLTAMRDAANEILNRFGINEGDVVYQNVDDESFTMSLHRKGRAYAQWQVDAIAPFQSQTRGTVVPARLCASGISITPLCLRVLNAIDGMMWEDRER